MYPSLSYSFLSCGVADAVSLEGLPCPFSVAAGRGSAKRRPTSNGARRGVAALHGGARMPSSTSELRHRLSTTCRLPLRQGSLIIPDPAARVLRDFQIFGGSTPRTEVVA